MIRKAHASRKRGNTVVHSQRPERTRHEYGAADVAASPHLQRPSPADPARTKKKPPGGRLSQIACRDARQKTWRMPICTPFWFLPAGVARLRPGELSDLFCVPSFETRASVAYTLVRFDRL